MGPSLGTAKLREGSLTAVLQMLPGECVSEWQHPAARWPEVRGAGLSGPGANNHTHYRLVIISSHHQAEGDTEAVIWISILSIISIISRRHYQLAVPRLSHVPGLTVTQGQCQCLARWGLCEVIDMFSESGHLHGASEYLIADTDRILGTLWPPGTMHKSDQLSVLAKKKVGDWTIWSVESLCQCSQ